MFKKLLIANRGEIALRIIRTARKLSIPSLAVYSPADVGSPFVREADEAIGFDNSDLSMSYLGSDNILKIAKMARADAVHPGYGFLSENSLFAKAVEEAGIAFVGPNSRAIELMGDKLTARSKALEVGVNVVPGFETAANDQVEGLAMASEIGFPVMIKASSGGGGKAMRVCERAEDFAQLYEITRNEATAFFGDGTIFIEKFITSPRHIEIQVIGDKHGNLITLGERDCSIQRRNQKVVEETPSPFLDDETRREMCRQAKQLGEAVNYDSAGTVEFIVDSDRNFYFLEMNTRLQVEHTVTEMVTGLDLVELMLVSASGQKLGINDAEPTGWAIETRLTSEDPSNDFSPSVGRINQYREPRSNLVSGSTIRVDSGVAEGSEVTVLYDSMIAKLITHGANRQAAIDAHIEALDHFVLRGVENNRTFLSSILQSAGFQNGDITTSFLSQELGLFDRSPSAQQKNVAIAVSAWVDYKVTADERIRNSTATHTIPPAKIFVADDNEYVVTREINTAAHDSSAQLALTITNENIAVNQVSSSWSFGDPVWQGTIDGVPHTVQLEISDNSIGLSFQGCEIAITIYTSLENELKKFMRSGDKSDNNNAIVSPMPGMIVRLAVSVGEHVTKGQAIVVLQAMKMENVIYSDRQGVIASIHVAENDNVAAKAVLLRFED